MPSDTDCAHEDDRGSTVMHVRADRWSCAVCGARFRLVPVEKWDRLAHEELGLDVDRLGVTLHRRRHDPKARANTCDQCRRDAGLIAAEYARLAATPAPSTEKPE